jgi:hypothetical protein
MTPYVSGSQIGVGIHDGTPAEQSVERYFRNLQEIPVDNNLLLQSSNNTGFSIAQNTILPGPSHMVPPLAHYDATLPGSDLFYEAGQREVDALALDFGYCDVRTECYPRFSHFNGWNSF